MGAAGSGAGCQNALLDYFSRHRPVRKLPYSSAPLKFFTEKQGALPHFFNRVLFERCEWYEIWFIHMFSSDRPDRLNCHIVYRHITVAPAVARFYLPDGFQCVQSICDLSKNSVTEIAAAVVEKIVVLQIDKEL